MLIGIHDLNWCIPKYVNAKTEQFNTIKGETIATNKLVASILGAVFRFY